MPEGTHLGALIKQQSRLNGLSYPMIVKRAKDRGEHLGKSNIGRVAAGDNPTLSRATIFGLAAGLGVTPATVARAALADMGIIMAEQEADAETAIRTDPTLPEGGRRMLLALLGEIKAAAIQIRELVGGVDQNWEFAAPSEEELRTDDAAAQSGK